MLVRGFYYDGWSLRESHKKDRNKREFLDHINEYFALDPMMDVEKAAGAVFEVLARHMGEGELDRVCAILPKDIRDLKPE